MSRRASALVAVMVLAVLVMATVAAAVHLLAAEEMLQAVGVSDEEASAVAEAGIEWSVSRLGKDPSFAGTRGRAFWRGSFDVEVSRVAGREDLREVRVTASVPGPQGRGARASFACLLRRGEEGRGGWGRLSWRRER